MMLLGSATFVLNFLQHHIARYSQVATGPISNNVYMLNAKMNLFEGSGNDYSFKGIPLTTDRNIGAKNGILHVISNSADYYPNVWEYLAKDSELSAIKNFFYAYNRQTLDTENSVQGPIVDGNITYLDSVMINTNTMMQYVGWLDREDSIYTMIIPTNKAWEADSIKIAKYFNYYSRNTAFVDSIRSINVRRALIRNLVFNNKLQQNKTDITLSPDSLISRRKDVFYSPHPTVLF